MTVILSSDRDLKRRLKRKRTRNRGRETTRSLMSGDMDWENQGAWSEFSEVRSKLSRSVVSVALSDGITVRFACSGIAIECKNCVTSFLTSAKLVKALSVTTQDHDNLKIQVRYGGNVFIGSLQEYDLDYGIAVVNVMTSLSIHGMTVKHVKPYSKVLALGRGISGKLITTTGILSHSSNGSEDNEDPMLSTCRIRKVCQGGPLFDVEGIFVGMNLYLVKEATVFVPASIILELLKHFRTSLRRSIFLARLKSLKADRSLKVKRADTDDLSRISKKDKRTDGFSKKLKKDKRTDDLSGISNKNKRTDSGGRKTTATLTSGHRDVLFGYRDSLNYPKLPIDASSDDLVLVNTFEETFADEYGEGVWNELSETVSSDLSQNVVALASFYGEQRIFACTGLFIEWNGFTTILTSASLVLDFVKDSNTFENLRIEVLGSDNVHREGTLQHYNLHYNVALVRVKDFCAPRPANIRHQSTNNHCKLVAVGRCFNTGILMAAKGIYRNRPTFLDCKLLQYSTCKITKAAIGGPAVDFQGNFVGLNFYDLKGVRTPFLLCDVILGILAYFNTKPTVAEVGHDAYQSGVIDWTIAGDESVRPNRWPVPKVFWGHAKSVTRYRECNVGIAPPRLLSPPTVRFYKGKRCLLY